MSNRIQLLDVTIRDGSYLNNFQFTVDDVRRIITGLEDAGIELIEVGHGVGLGASEAGYGFAAASDEDYLRIAAETVSKAKLATMILPGVGDIRLIELAAKYGVHLLRIAPNVTEVEKAEPYVREARKLGLMTSVNLLKTYLVSVQEMVDIARKAEDFGADVLYLVDSAGGMTVEDTTERVRGLVGALKVPVGFHGHNNISLAQANAIAAAREGAAYIDTSLCGMGRSGGNVQTEVFAGFLLREGYQLNVDLMKLLVVADKVVKPLMPYQQGIGAEEFIYGHAQLHSSFEKLVNKFSDRYGLSRYRLISCLGRSRLVTPVEEVAHEIVKDFIRSEKKEYYPYRPGTSVASEAEKQAFEIIARAGQTRKTAFIITSFPTAQNNGGAKFSPVREGAAVVYGNVQTGKIEDAEEVVRAVDGLVDAVIVDSEIKIPGLSGLADRVHSLCRRSLFFTYKDIDVWAESVESLVSAICPLLTDKRILIIGTGDLFSKLVVRLAEDGAMVFIQSQGADISAALIVTAINKRQNIVSVEDISGIVCSVDMVIGCDLMSSCIDENIIRSIKNGAVVIDAGRGTLTEKAVMAAKERDITVYGFDMRPGFAGLITRLFETTAFLEKVRGESVVDGIRIVAGGVIGGRGDIIVDSISNPSSVIGIADGKGKILADGSFQEKIQRVKKAFGIQ
jgi:4-hydroxy-2-oxovalerate aldolase